MTRSRGPRPRFTRRLVSAVLLVLLVLSTTATAHPPRFTLEGTVRDRELQAPIAGATVSLVVSRRTATTADDGSFSFGALQISGADQLLIEHAEYRSVTIPLGALGPERWHLDITIDREVEYMPGSAPDPASPR